MKVFLLLLLSAGLMSQTYLVQLTVVDVADDAPLPFVSVQLHPGGTSGQTDEAGNITLRAPRGSYILRASYTGYAPFEQEILLRQNIEATLRLETTAEQLQTVTVTDRDLRSELVRARMGVERLSAEQLQSLPTVLGERDVLRSLQLLPGVTSAGEASNGISVRGGTIDQNLLLYDGAPVFTPTHLFGLFTVFTPDAVGGVDLYRGNIPARFGGRVAAVLDVTSKTPSPERTEIRGGIGVVSSNLSIETPLDKAGKLALLLAARGSYSDFVFPVIKRLKDTKSRFADATLKLRYRAGDKNFLTLSGFYSQDFYEIGLLNSFSGISATSNQYAYLTLNGGLEWLHLMNDRFSLKVGAYRANFDPELRFPQPAGPVVGFRSGIDYTTLKSLLTFTPDHHDVLGGIQIDRFTLQPGVLDPGGSSSVRPVSLTPEQVVEASLFFEDEWRLSDRLTLSGGVRAVLYRQLGPGELRRYAADRPVTVGSLIETISVGKGEKIVDYGGLEPRAGLSLRISESSRFKLSYARSRQYMHNIYNSTTPVPTSRWKVSDPNVGPQRADLYSAGISHLTASGAYSFQLEGYYRAIDDLLEYRPGADFFLNPTVETDLIRGRGRAYGLEVAARHLTGRLTGEVNYTYARVENRVTGGDFSTSINRGAWYPGYFDQPHTFTANLTLDEGRTHELGFNLVVQSNRPYTVPNGFVTIRDTPVPLFLERNNDRLPVYHRLDFSWTIHNFRREKRKWTGDWVFTVYNVYGRDNVYNIYFQPRNAGTPALGIFGGSPFAAYRLSIFGAPILSLAYKFTLLPN
ncbi:hypothetical protein GGR28_001885 [Lewinella aquimaris]|uniref:TonB-dependent receptor n=1 Tax=Neolewinella aquimaris TaxID=1835722 RepID=A0A840E6M0_9BACT|nr:TonB-dependent receptor [Neolewinella aquimaris]MBB4079265.1 hypothetical protein [Neolewinella aquimaris]